MSLPECFPVVDYVTAENYFNPAFHLFGQRFYKDQTTLELLSEFLYITFAEKKIGGSNLFSTPFRAMNAWLNGPIRSFIIKFPFGLRPNSSLCLGILGSMGVIRFMKSSLR